MKLFETYKAILYKITLFFFFFLRVNKMLLWSSLPDMYHFNLQSFGLIMHLRNWYKYLLSIFVFLQLKIKFLAMQLTFSLYCSSQRAGRHFWWSYYADIKNTFYINDKKWARCLQKSDKLFFFFFYKIIIFRWITAIMNIFELIKNTVEICSGSFNSCL